MATVLYNENRIHFELELKEYGNIISFLIENKLEFLSEMILDIPPALHGNGVSNNLLEYLTNNNDKYLLSNFITYFMRLIDIKNDDNIKFQISESFKWQTMKVSIIKTTTTTTTMEPTTTTTTTTILRNIKYGRLYNYNIATLGNIIPNGWHIPTVEEWDILFTACGGISVAGGELKSTGTTYWNSPNIGATDQFNFNSLPGGGGYDGGNFDSINVYSYYWAITESLIIFSNNSISANILYARYTGNLFSIRLIKNDSIYEGDVIYNGCIYNTVKIGEQVWMQQNLATIYNINGTPITSFAYNNDESLVYY